MSYEGITIIAEKEATYTGVLVTGDRQTLIDHLKHQYGAPLPVVDLVIKLSCGHQVVYKTEDDIPDHDVPCPCGDPRHWMIRYRQE